MKMQVACSGHNRTIDNICNKHLIAACQCSFLKGFVQDMRNLPSLATLVPTIRPPSSRFGSFVVRRLSIAHHHGRLCLFIFFDFCPYLCECRPAAMGCLEVDAPVAAGLPTLELPLDEGSYSRRSSAADVVKTVSDRHQHKWFGKPLQAYSAGEEAARWIPRFIQYA